MVVIPAGSFLIGSPPDDELRADEEPHQHEISLDGFAIGTYPVTVGQFRAFIEAGGYREQRHWTREGWRLRRTRTQPDHWLDEAWAGDDRLPVVGISWYEAAAYTCWLSEATRQAYRLPTEAEWEKAARGGLHVPDGQGSLQDNRLPSRRWPWGDELPDPARLNFNGNVGHTTPVGSYLLGASPYGALDMAGNVWEWCVSRWAAPYVYPEDTNLESEGERVVRGGSWFNTAGQARCSYRLRLIPNLRFDHDVGFRLVRQSFQRHG
jgi:formylglycine-generating enzyme required for sulfatase activity